MYIWRAYQSPISGTASGPQQAQNPSLASRNHSGARYCLSDSKSGVNDGVLVNRCEHFRTNHRCRTGKRDEPSACDFHANTSGSNKHNVPSPFTPGKLAQ